MDRPLVLDPEPRSRQLRERLLTVERATVPATLLECLRVLFPFDRAQVMLREEGSRLSVRARFDGERVVALPAGERLELDPDDHPVLRQALFDGAAVVVPDTRAHAGWTLPAEPPTEASWMGVPLFARGEVAGLLTLSRREPAAFDEEHVRLTETTVS